MKVKKRELRNNTKRIIVGKYINLDKIILDNLKNIYRSFGRLNQLEKLYEELEELKKETLSVSITDELIEEMADVLVLIFQFYLCESQVADKLFEKVNEKVDRTIKRIKEKHYE